MTYQLTPNAMLTGLLGSILGIGRPLAGTASEALAANWSVVSRLESSYWDQRSLPRHPAASNRIALGRFVVSLVLTGTVPLSGKVVLVVAARPDLDLLRIQAASLTCYDSGRGNHSCDGVGWVSDFVEGAVAVARSES